MQDYSLFYQVARFLQKKMKYTSPFHVRRLELGTKLDGSCEEKGPRFLIKINKNLPANHAIDVLIHEVAHAAAWKKDKDIHGINWGKAYSKIYRIFLKEFCDY